MYIWNYYVNSCTRMWMSTKRCFRDLFSSLWWISWVRVQTGSPKSKGIASSKHSQRWMRFEVFFLVELDILSKKNTTQKGKFCFASPMEMASHFSIETNKQVTSTLLLCCVFFLLMAGTSLRERNGPRSACGGAWCGGRSCMSHGKGHEDPWNLSRECA